MYHHLAFLVALLASTQTTLALPLNINLGAYSPALVVGDGEISFGGKQDVSNLMTALEGAAVQSAAANGGAAPGVARLIAPRPAELAPPAADTIEDPNKPISPRLDRRGIEGFNAALKYASDALKTGPKIELGTGAEGSGVGIIQQAGINAPAVAEGAKKAEKRDLPPAMRTTVTKMYVRGGPMPAITVEESPIMDGPSVRARSENADAPVQPRAQGDGGIDGVNLNMAEGQVAELTIVETKPVGEDDN